MMTREQLLAERIGYCALQADTINSELMALKDVPSNSMTESYLRGIEAALSQVIDFTDNMKRYKSKGA